MKNPPKTLGEIVDAVKDGQKPDYEDLRYAVAAMASLRHFDYRALMQLSETKRKGTKPILTGDPEWQFAEAHRRGAMAYAKPPKGWLGPSNDPDDPECVARVARSRALFYKLLAQPEGSGNSNNDQI